MARNVSSGSRRWFRRAREPVVDGIPTIGGSRRGYLSESQSGCCDRLFRNSKRRPGNASHRDSRYDEGITNRAFPHKEGTEKSGQSDYCVEGTVYKLDAAPKCQKAQNVGIGTQENCCGTTETMGEIPQTASLKANHRTSICLRFRPAPPDYW